jgi:hypothetical protein
MRVVYECVPYRVWHVKNMYEPAAIVQTKHSRKLITMASMLAKAGKSIDMKVTMADDAETDKRGRKRVKNHQPYDFISLIITD